MRLRHVIRAQEHVRKALKEFVAFSSIPLGDYEHHGLKLVPFVYHTGAADYEDGGGTLLF